MRWQLRLRWCYHLLIEFDLFISFPLLHNRPSARPPSSPFASNVTSSLSITCLITPQSRPHPSWFYTPAQSPSIRQLLNDLPRSCLAFVSLPDFSMYTSSASSNTRFMNSSKPYYANETGGRWASRKRVWRSSMNEWSLSRSKKGRDRDWAVYCNQETMR
jgi:hypothetical protein